MKTSALAVGLLIALGAVPANADVVFSTMHTPVTPNSTRITLPNSGVSGSVPRGGPIAESFYVSAATTITDVKLQLTANNPSDGASVLVYLVPDTGAGGTGVAALPTFTGTGSSLSLSGATLIGSIADSLLSSTTSGSLQTFNTSLSVAAGEYWIAVENTTGTGGVAGTAKWVFDVNPYTDGTGTIGQEVFWQAGQSGFPGYGTPAAFSDTHYSTVATDPGQNNLYLAQVDTPEPFSVAVLGVGLAGIGMARRLRRRT
ncbi:MAG TPA: hypothetical protein VGC09_15975 [Rhodopila sp.]